MFFRLRSSSPLGLDGWKAPCIEVGVIKRHLVEAIIQWLEATKWPDDNGEGDEKQFNEMSTALRAQVVTAYLKKWLGAQWPFLNQQITRDDELLHEFNLMGLLWFVTADDRGGCLSPGQCFDFVHVCKRVDDVMKTFGETEKIKDENYESFRGLVDVCKEAVEKEEQVVW